MLEIKEYFKGSDLLFRIEFGFKSYRDYLDLVENHHIKGTLHNKECTNFCLVGATYVAADLFDFEKGDIFFYQLQFGL